MFTYCSFDITKNKLDYFRGKNCMKNFWLNLKEHATKIINYGKKKKKEMIPLTREEEKIHCKQKKYYICKKIFSMMMMTKKYFKVKENILENTEVLLTISAI